MACHHIFEGGATGLSVAKGSIEINVETQYLLPVSGKSWKGNAPETVKIGGSHYQVVVNDSGSVPSFPNGANGSTNLNHAELLARGLCRATG